MAEADVVSGDDEPGAVGLGDALRDLLAHLREIARAGIDALLGIAAILESQRLRGIGGEHHDTACTLVRLRARIPLRFLVADRREQPPVEARFRRGLLEPRTIPRQALGDVFLEFARFLVCERAGVTRALLQQLREPARGLLVAEERIDAREQAGRVPAHQPLHRALLGQCEPHLHVWIEVAREGKLARIDDGVLRHAAIDVLDRIGGARCGLLPPEPRRYGAAQALQDVLLRAPGAYRQPRGLELQRFPGPYAVALVHDELRYARIDLRGVGDAIPLGGAGERGGGDVGAARGELRLQRALVRERVDGESYPEPRRIGAGELVFQPFRALGPEVVTGRQVQRGDAQLAACADHIQRGRRALAAARDAKHHSEQRNEDDCAQEPPRAPRAFR